MKAKLLVIAILTISLSAFSQKKEAIKDFKLKSTTVYSEEYEDSKGLPVKESYNAFDVNGNLLEEIEYDNNGKEKKHITYEYDAQGNKIKETHLKPNGSKDKIIEYKYQSGLKFEKIVYNGNGKIKSKKKYLYEFHK